MRANWTSGILGAFILTALGALAAACDTSTGGGTPDCGDFAACWPDCPSYPVITGDPCPAEGQRCGWSDECQWRGSATCVAGAWQMDEWIDPEGQWDCECNSSCLPCPAELPAKGDPCDATVQLHSCDYPSQACVGTTVTAVCSGDSWTLWESGATGLTTCPAALPVAGAPCSACLLAKDCSYFDESGCPAQLACESGVWAITPSTCTPASACAAKTLSECAAAADCRWLSHARCPTFPESFTQGCYPADVCGSDQDCPAGTACNAVEVDPCPSGACDACSAATMACLP